MNIKFYKKKKKTNEKEKNRRKNSQIYMYSSFVMINLFVRWRGERCVFPMCNHLRNVISEVITIRNKINHECRSLFSSVKDY